MPPGSRVSTRFVIGREGHVTSVIEGESPVEQDWVLAPREVPKTTPMPDRKVVSCVHAAFLALVFPPPTEGIVTVVYPIAFSPSKEPAGTASSAPVAPAAHGRPQAAPQTR